MQSVAQTSDLDYYTRAANEDCINGGSGTRTKYTYDNVSRIASVTDPAGSLVRLTYDAADRPTGATYPDGTTTKMAYTQLDLTSSTDRLHQITRYAYNADRELISTTDQLNHKVQMGYNVAGKLNSITDANNNTTTIMLDDESRVIGKSYANGKSISIAYENNISRMSTFTDALSSSTEYTYNADNTTATISYPNAAPYTPSVSFSYDPVYQRVVSMTDGVGTTTYSYFPVSAGLGANQLRSVVSPISATSNTDTVAYTYDARNRVIGTTINGVAQSAAFDALGRLTSVSNPLDTFTYTYADGTPRVSGVTSNSGPTAAMTYFGPTGDALLQQISVTTHTGGASLAQFGYTYNADDNVASVAVSTPSAQTTSYAYDAANRLVSGLYSGSTPQYAYTYDAASNVKSITTGGSTQNLSYTSTNALATGPYNANGSPNSLGVLSYAWDGANRLVRVVNSAANTASTFTYDGLGRLVQVVDSKGGAVTGNHSYTWCGTARCVAHDNTQSGSPISTQYFARGAIVSGTPYYYVRDRLGSVTQLVTAAGSVATQYTYDPYGNRTTVSGTVAADIGYAGYFYEATSGLEFALYRAYDPVHARWLNRDPIGEAGGLNLYAYVDGNPLSDIDPYGLCTLQIGITINLQFGIFTAQISGGIAIDGTGGIGIYGAGPVAGGGIGDDISGGLSVAYSSNAATIDDLNGPFANLSVGGGAGPHASADIFAGQGAQGQLVTGAGATIGVGVGGGVAATVTSTVITPLGKLW